MKQLLFILVALSGLNALGQDTATRQTGHIYKKSGHWRLDNQKLSEKELKTELYKVPAAIPVYKKAKTSETISVISSLAAIGCLLLNSPNSNPPYKQHNGWLYPAIGLSGNAFFFLLQSMKLTKTAVQIRNENLKSVY